MEKMEFIYTSGWEKFEQYCKELYRGYLNRYCQGNEKACEDEINKAYAMGMNFIREKVKENKEILKQLWVAAFIGNLARKYDLTVTVRTQSCVFILGLFNLLPYDAMKTTSINYPFSNLSLTEYEVGELFYNTAKDVFRYLINISMSEENACYWTEVIRKGQFADKYEKGNNKNEADYFDDSEVEMFKAVKYLPSEILVLTTYELYKRCAVQNKITQIRDLERQKEWFGYRK